MFAQIFFANFLTVGLRPWPWGMCCSRVTPCSVQSTVQRANHGKFVTHCVAKIGPIDLKQNYSLLQMFFSSHNKAHLRQFVTPCMVRPNGFQTEFNVLLQIFVLLFLWSLVGLLFAHFLRERQYHIGYFMCQVKLLGKQTNIHPDSDVSTGISIIGRPSFCQESLLRYKIDLYPNSDVCTGISLAIARPCLCPLSSGASV